MHGNELAKVVGEPAHLPGGFKLSGTVLDLAQLPGKSLDPVCQGVIGSKAKAHVTDAVTSAAGDERMFVYTGAAA
jgi:hypothetical protein